MKLRNIDQSKYTIEEVFDNQKADNRVIELLTVFHERLLTTLENKDKQYYIRTHIRGLTYFCNDRKAFMGMDIRQSFLSIVFFTGNNIINGISKGIWVNRGDNRGSERCRIFNESSINPALDMALEAHRIAKEWSE
jgi:hypothetical protein